MKRSVRKFPLIFIINLLATLALGATAVEKTIEAQVAKAEAKSILSDAKDCTDYLGICIARLQNAQSEKEQGSSF